MLPMSYLVLQPRDVIARTMTSSITVLPPTIHAVTSFGSIRPAIVPYVHDTFGARDESTASHDTGMTLASHGVTPIPDSDGRLPRSADQVTWSNVEATPFPDDVISHLPVTSLDHAHRPRPTLTSGSGDVSQDEQQQLYPLYCVVCRVKLNSGEQARQHFEGRTHARRVRLTSSASRVTDSRTDQVSNSDRRAVLMIRHKTSLCL